MNCVLVGLMLAAMGAAPAPKKPAAPASKPAATKDLKIGMTEDEVMAALKKSGVTVVKREEKGDSAVILTLSDRRRVVIGSRGVSNMSRDNMPETPAELQKDAKVGMTEEEATAAIEKAGVKVTERIAHGDGAVLKLSDGRGVVVRADKVISIQVLQTQPTKK